MRGDIGWGFAALLRWKGIIVSSVPDILAMRTTVSQKLLLQSCLLATQVYQLWVIPLCIPGSSGWESTLYFYKKWQMHCELWCKLALAYCTQCPSHYLTNTQVTLTAMTSHLCRDICRKGALQIPHSFSAGLKGSRSCIINSGRLLLYCWWGALGSTALQLNIFNSDFLL